MHRARSGNAATNRIRAGLLVNWETPIKRDFLVPRLSEIDGPMRQRSDDTFGRLMLLEENRFALSAVKRLREPSPPIVTLFGPSGVGKTHLVRQFIGEVQRQDSTRRLSHLNANEFTAQFTKASHAESIPELQDSMRRSDFFVCEDLQSIEGRHESQQQLLVIIDEVVANGGQVLFSCRKSPGELKEFSSKLRSRCLGGVCAHMPLPDVPSRHRLLMHFASARGVFLEDELAGLIAESMVVSPRELRGLITQLQVAANQRREPITRDLVNAVIRNAACDECPTISQITKIVASEFDVTVSALRSTGRVRAVVLPRQIAMFAAREWGKRPYADVGQYFGRRSHSTIVHACQRVRDRLDNDIAFRQQLDGLRDRLQIT